jgi:hypothetical protein
MTRRLRVRGKYRQPLDEDQIALAFLMLAKLLREEEQAGEKQSPRRTERRAA